MYTNMPIVLGSGPSPYSDTPNPKRFGTVSPLDPELFSSIDEYVKGLLSGHQSRKYSPIEVAQWLEECASRAEAGPPSSKTPEFRRLQEDVAIQSALGRFFSLKLRSAVFFEIFLETANPTAGAQALAEYRKARNVWASMARQANGIYLPDVTYGRTPNRRGHWLDRIPAIDTDVAAMEMAVRRSAGAASAVVLEGPPRIAASCTHTPPASFTPGKPFSVSLLLIDAPSSARLHYRHVNHAERWQSVDMRRADQTFAAAIPADYTNSPFSLQYYFELRQGPNSACMYPGLNAELANQPYFVVVQTEN
jgi:hypothetical protein